MPLVIHPRVGRRLRRIAALTAVACFGATSAAHAACPTQTLKQPFGQFGDTGSYFAAPGGTFEGTTSWSLLNKTSAVTGNEPWFINAATDAKALQITNGTATSPAFCVDATMPSFRMFARQTAKGTGLLVRLVYTDGAKVSHTDDFGTLADGTMSTWGATTPMSLASALPIPAGGSLNVQLRLQTLSGTGTWQVDDVEIDPYRA